MTFDIFLSKEDEPLLLTGTDPLSPADTTTELQGIFPN